MASRPTWQGHLRLSLVTCPVALYTATSSAADISFHLINPETDNRIRMVATDPDTGPIERSKLVKGYEYEKNRYVVLTDADLASVKIESSKTIDIERFVEAGEIDRLYWNDPFYLVPDGKMAAEAYGVILQAMAQSGRLALGRLVMHTRERLIALEPRGPGIVAYTLRSRDEVRPPDALFKEIPQAKDQPAMVEIAMKIIDQLSGPFEPEMFTDRYEAALTALIQTKLKGEGAKITAPEPQDTNASDLMALLRRSLQGSAKPAPRASAAKGEPARKPKSTSPRRASVAKRH
jgi:DNA end-binding protein Ku